MCDRIKENLLLTMECGSMGMDMSNYNHPRGQADDFDIFRKLSMLVLQLSILPALFFSFFLPFSVNVPLPTPPFYLSLPEINGRGNGVSYRNQWHAPDLTAERNNFEG